MAMQGFDCGVTSVIFLDNGIEEGREDAVGFRVRGVHTDTRVQVRYPRLCIKEQCNLTLMQNKDS
jgi:hypothetical protein